MTGLERFFLWLLGLAAVVLAFSVLGTRIARADTLRANVEDRNPSTDPNGVRPVEFEAFTGGSWVTVPHANVPRPPSYRPEVRPASVTVPQSGCVPLRAYYVLSDGGRLTGPSNVVTYCPPPVPSLACRADLNADGGVGLDDVGIVFGQAAQGARCP